MQKKNNSSVKPRRGTSNTLQSFPPKIPQLRTNVGLRHTFRYRASSALSTVSIQDQQVLAALGTVCTVLNTTVAVLAKTYRFKRIEMWAPVVTNGTPVTLTVEFSQTLGPNREFSDTAISQNMPAHLKILPSQLKDSTVMFWKTYTSASAMVLSCPAGTIIDIEVEYILDDDAAILPLVSVAAGTLAFLYFLALDGPSTNLLVPVGLQTTA